WPETDCGTPPTSDAEELRTIEVTACLTTWLIDTLLAMKPGAGLVSPLYLKVSVCVATLRTAGTTTLKVAVPAVALAVRLAEARRVDPSWTLIVPGGVPEPRGTGLVAVTVPL